VLPIKDTIPTRRFPVLTVAFIAANLGVWLLVQDAGGEPGFSQSLLDLAYRPCEVDGACVDRGEPWPVNAFAAMFMHGGWGHLLGNMLFLWIFGNNIEDELGRIRFIVFYLAGGFAATALQTFVVLTWGSAGEATLPNVGASGAIAAVLGGYILLHPRSLVLTWIAPIFLVPIPAFLYLGLWFVFQLISGGSILTAPQESGGVAYFAHIGGFVFGLLTVRLFHAGQRQRVAW
jgi:membrane associated rhomboid family serine protease